MKSALWLSTLLLSASAFASGENAAPSVECADAIAKVAEKARALGALQGASATATDRPRSQKEIDLATEIAQDSIRSAGAICK